MSEEERRRMCPMLSTSAANNNKHRNLRLRSLRCRSHKQLLSNPPYTSPSPDSSKPLAITILLRSPDKIQFSTSISLSGRRLCDCKAKRPAKLPSQPTNEMKFVEDINHLFRSCSFSDLVWTFAGILPFPSNFPNVESIPTSIVYVVASIGASYRNVNGPSVAPTSKAAEIIRWIHYAPNWVKLNFDGSVISTSGAVGFVIRDSFGVPLVAGARRLHISSVPIAECCAVKDGLAAVKRFNFKSIVVEGDSLLMINCVKNACEVPWCLKSHVRDVIHVASEFDNISFVHVLREANFLAEALANLGHSLHASKIWLGALPPQAAQALQLDTVIIRCPTSVLL
ncbi:hypothetical protein ACLB2K_044539 [Fragaria x ananassa]